VNIPAAARAAAESTLTDTAVVTRRGKDSFVAGQGAVPGAVEPIWSGPCSVGPPGSSDETSSGSDEKTIETRVVRLPVNDGTAAIEVGDSVVVGDDRYTVSRTQHRTTEVLRRIRVVAAVDAEGVPR